MICAAACAADPESLTDPTGYFLVVSSYVYYIVLIPVQQDKTLKTAE